MEEIDPESLAEIAYGIFEIFLDRELRDHGPYLFELLERGSDLGADVREIFGRFREDYPGLAEALLQRFGSIDTIYAQLLAGEGIIPSRTTLMYWIVQDGPGPVMRRVDDERVENGSSSYLPVKWTTHGERSGMRRHEDARHIGESQHREVEP